MIFLFLGFLGGKGFVKTPRHLSHAPNISPSMPPINASNSNPPPLILAQKLTRPHSASASPEIQFDFHILRIHSARINHFYGLVGEFLERAIERVIEANYGAGMWEKIMKRECGKSENQWAS